MIRPSATDPAAMVIGVDAGAIGRLVRLLAGALLVAGAAVALAVRHDAGAALEVLAFFLVQLAVHFLLLVLLADRVLVRVDPWIASFILYLPSIVLGALGGSGIHVLAEVAPVATALYVGVGLVVMGVTGYGGCEVIAVANLLLGRRQLMYCPFNAVDLAERAVRVDRRQALAYAFGAAALLVGGAYVLLGDAGLLSRYIALPALNRRWALLLLLPGAFFGLGALLRARGVGWHLDFTARSAALGAAALVLAALTLSGVVPQRVTWPLILFGATIVALIRAGARWRR